MIDLDYAKSLIVERWWEGGENYDWMQLIIWADITSANANLSTYMYHILASVKKILM